MCNADNLELIKVTAAAENMKMDLRFTAEPATAIHRNLIFT